MEYHKLNHLAMMSVILEEFTPSYILHTRAFGNYLLEGLFTLQKKL